MAETFPTQHKTEDEKRAALIEELLTLSSSMVEALRFGTTQEAARNICNMILPYTNADAISITDKEIVLAYVGFMQEEFKSGVKIRTKVTREVLETGKSRTVKNEDEIGFMQAHHKINAAIVEPLVVAGNPVGVIKFYYRSALQVTKSQRMIARGFSRLISTQIAAQETEHQRELNALMEVKMLQSQINPHFLFNTINTISSLTRTDAEKAREMLRDFAGFYRATLAKADETITLAEEIDTTRKYTALQQMRFGEDRLQFKVCLPQEYQEALQVPPFIFQPVVENSILHGMPTTGTLHITIAGEVEGKNLLVRVIDDGVGMSPEIREMLFKESPITTRGLGLAMRNVYDRVKGHFGKRSNIIVSSEIGKGTTTTFVFPTSSFSSCAS